MEFMESPNAGARDAASPSSGAMNDVVLLTIFCDDRSHAPRQAKIGMFKHYNRDGREGWDLIASGAYFSAQQTTDVVEPRVHLADDGTVSDDQLVRAWSLPEAGRLRFKLECSLCGLALTARSDRLWPILDTVAPHAKRAEGDPRGGPPPRVFRLPLSFLAAKVASSS